MTNISRQNPAREINRSGNDGVRQFAGFVHLADLHSHLASDCRSGVQVGALSEARHQSRTQQIDQGWYFCCESVKG